MWSFDTLLRFTSYEGHGNSFGVSRRPVLRRVHRSFSEVGSFMRRMEALAVSGVAHQSEEGRRRMAGTRDEPNNNNLEKVFIRGNR